MQAYSSFQNSYLSDKVGCFLAILDVLPVEVPVHSVDCNAISVQKATDRGNPLQDCFHVLDALTSASTAKGIRLGWPCSKLLGRDILQYTLTVVSTSGDTSQLRAWGDLVRGAQGRCRAKSILLFCKSHAGTIIYHNDCVIESKAHQVKRHLQGRETLLFSSLSSF